MIYPQSDMPLFADYSPCQVCIIENSSLQSIRERGGHRVCEKQEKQCIIWKQNSCKQRWTVRFLIGKSLLLTTCGYSVTIDEDLLFSPLFFLQRSLCSKKQKILGIEIFCFAFCLLLVLQAFRGKGHNLFIVFHLIQD